jgi:hypothetical protein
MTPNLMDEMHWVLGESAVNSRRDLRMSGTDGIV